MFVLPFFFSCAAAVPIAWPPIAQDPEAWKLRVESETDTAVRILTDEAVASAANLKLTSLYELARKAELPDPQDFVQQFIDYEEARRRES